MTKHQSKETVKGYMLKIPSTLHKKLVTIAIKERRSLGDQIIYTLEQSLKSSSD
jgi:predicted HicB family RNase H-like nuclease